MFDWKIKKESKYSNRDYRSCNFSGDWTKHYINDYVDSLIINGVITTHENLAEYKDEHLPKSLYKFYPSSIYSLIKKSKIYTRRLKDMKTIRLTDNTKQKKHLLAHLFVHFFVLKRNILSTNENTHLLSKTPIFDFLNYAALARLFRVALYKLKPSKKTRAGARFAK